MQYLSDTDVGGNLIPADLSRCYSEGADSLQTIRAAGGLPC